MTFWRRLLGKGHRESLQPQRLDYLNEGLALERQGDFEAALTSYRLAFRDNPSDSRILLNMAIAFTKTGQPEEAIRHYKRDFTGLTVAIVGDVLHSRVARSLIHGLTTLGTPEVRVIAPRTLLPTHVETLGVRVFTDMAAGLAGCDVVVMLRLQSERMKGALLPSAGEYFKHYGLTMDKLAVAKPDVIVMHPGPMNRGVEIDSAVADGERSVILPQVTFGIAVRMAVMSIIAGN